MWDTREGTFTGTEILWEQFKKFIESVQYAESLDSDDVALDKINLFSHSEKTSAEAPVKATETKRKELWIRKPLVSWHRSVGRSTCGWSHIEILHVVAHWMHDKVSGKCYPVTHVAPARVPPRYVLQYCERSTNRISLKLIIWTVWAFDKVNSNSVIC